MGRRGRVAEPAVSRAGVTGYDPEAVDDARKTFRAPDRPAPAGEGQ